VVDSVNLWLFANVKFDDSKLQASFLTIKPHTYPLTLSKHTQLMEPATLMTLEFMQ